MSNEDWRKIKQFQEETERQEDIARRRLENAELERKKLRLQSQQDEDKRKREDHDAKIKKIEQAKKIVLPILETIRKNAKEIRQASHNDIVVDDDKNYGMETSNLRLRWGNKLEPTGEEAHILEEYRYKKEGIFGSFTGAGLPKEFVAEDYDYIEVSLSPYWSKIGSNFIELDAIIVNPDSFLPLFATALRHPFHQYKKCSKGSDYWETDRSWTPYDPTDRSGYQ